MDDFDNHDGMGPGTWILIGILVGLITVLFGLAIGSPVVFSAGPVAGVSLVGLVALVR